MAVILLQGSDNFREAKEEQSRSAHVAVGGKRRVSRRIPGFERSSPRLSPIFQHPNNGEYPRYPRQAQFARLTRRLIPFGVDDRHRFPPVIIQLARNTTKQVRRLR